MLTIECPECCNIAEVEGQDLPKLSCDDFLVTCEHCDNSFHAGWVAELEYR